MIVRLGFAVAAHLEPEILIVDEVLAVGDAEFQEKCIGKMKDISNAGRTVLFVSHNMASMKALCQKGILMEHGQIIQIGTMNDVIETYLSRTTKTAISGEIPSSASRINTGVVKFTSILLQNAHGETVQHVNYHSKLNFVMQLESAVELKDVMLDLRIHTRDGVELVHTMNKYSNPDKQSIHSGVNEITCQIDNQLQPGNYTVSIGAHETNGLTLEFVENILDFTVLNVGENEDAGFVYDFKLGHVFFNSNWKIK
jgi:lipopolysaccharide transport system ATP-binding protein